MSLVPPVVESYPTAERLPARSRTGAHWLVLSCYLLGALILTWRLWADPAGRVQTGDTHDVDLFAWFMRYAATAIGHGRLPALVTTALNAPPGISLMWNTSLLLPGMLLTPVTLLAGPQVSLTVVLTLGYAGSAASLFLVLRRWQASITAAALGGAVYGFSPALVNSGFGHYHLEFAVLPPLIIDALLRIAMGRGHAVRAGAWLGLLVAAQVFISEELLVDTAVAGLVLVAALAAGRPRTAFRRAPRAAIGLAAGAAVMLLICGRAVWVQFLGPLREHSILINPWLGSLSSAVTPSTGLLFHTSASAAVAGRFHLGLSEYLSYLGWPLLAVLVAATIRFWRDPKVRATAVTWAVLELCSLGGGTLTVGGFHYPGMLLPWHWLQGVPGLAELLPDRFAILADGAAAALLAFSLDLARSPAPRTRWWRISPIPAVVAVLAILPLIPMPFGAASLPPVPAGWQATFARLRLASDAPVLVVPVPLMSSTQAMRWQADTGKPGSLIEGYFLGPGRNGQAAFSPGPAKPAAHDLNRIWAGPSRHGDLSTAQLRADLAFWRPAAVVAVTSRTSALAHLLTRLLGRPTVQIARILAWRL